MTIKELADELGVSKQAIRKHLEKLPPTLSVTKKENAIYLDTAVTAFVRSKVTRVTGNLTSNVTGNKFNEKEADNNLKRDEKNANNYEIEKILNEQLKIKDKQLAEKDKQIQTMQKLLDQQQQLSLQSNKQIEKLQFQLSNEPVEDLIHSTSNQLVNDKDENSETISANKSFFSRIFKKQSN
mgnify:FL=1